jgi:hypothetical protein
MLREKAQISDNELEKWDKKRDGIFPATLLTNSVPSFLLPPAQFPEAATWYRP